VTSVAIASESSGRDRKYETDAAVAIAARIREELRRRGR
jgi:hypothetical protein